MLAVDELNNLIKDNELVKIARKNCEKVYTDVQNVLMNHGFTSDEACSIVSKINYAAADYSSNVTIATIYCILDPDTKSKMNMEILTNDILRRNYEEFGKDDTINNETMGD